MGEAGDVVGEFVLGSDAGDVVFAGEPANEVENCGDGVDVDVRVNSVGLFDLHHVFDLGAKFVFDFLHVLGVERTKHYAEKSVAKNTVLVVKQRIERRVDVDGSALDYVQVNSDREFFVFCKPLESVGGAGHVHHEACAVQNSFGEAIFDGLVDRRAHAEIICVYDYFQSVKFL